MSKIRINVDQLAKEISRSLNEFTEEVIEDSKTAITEVSKESHKILKDKAPESDRKRKKKYRKSISRKKTYESISELRYILYLNSPNYRLTHLLEFGHALRNGGRSKAIPHFKYADEFIEKNLEKRFISKLNRRR